MPAIEEVGVCISQRAISTYAMYYSKLDQIVNVFYKCVVGVVAYENLKTKENEQSVIHKSVRGPLRERSPTPISL